MRIALHATGEVGRRTGRILLAEPALTALGLYGQAGATEERKTMAVRELGGFSVLVTDEPAENDARALAGIASDDGLSTVLAIDAAVDAELEERVRSAGTTLLLGASLPALAQSLAAHETADGIDAEDLTIAWTLPGSPLRRGEAIAFPDPIGARWGREVAPPPASPAARHYEVPVEGPWAAVMARIGGNRRHRRTVGAADLGTHLEAIALAAGAYEVALGTYPPGICRPTDAAGSYLASALRMGLAVAAFTARR